MSVINIVGRTGPPRAKLIRPTVAKNFLRAIIAFAHVGLCWYYRGGGGGGGGGDGAGSMRHAFTFGCNSWRQRIWRVKHVDADVFAPLLGTRRTSGPALV